MKDHAKSCVAKATFVAGGAGRYEATRAPRAIARIGFVLGAVALAAAISVAAPAHAEQPRIGVTVENAPGARIEVIVVMPNEAGGLDRFFGDFVETCDGSPELAATIDALLTALRPPTRVDTLDIRIPGMSGQAKVEYDEDIIAVVIPLEGTHRGLEVREFEFAFVPASSFMSTFIWFSEGREVVELNIGAQVGAGIEGFQEGEIWEIELLVDFDGRVGLFCG